jgi:hypothetical protein
MPNVFRLDLADMRRTLDILPEGILRGEIRGDVSIRNVLAANRGELAGVAACRSSR